MLAGRFKAGDRQQGFRNNRLNPNRMSGCSTKLADMRSRAAGGEVSAEVQLRPDKEQRQEQTCQTDWAAKTAHDRPRIGNKTDGVKNVQRSH
jgi:hypothetical protein